MTHPITRPAFLGKFTCLGEACEDTCCKGWGMQVDSVTAAKYASEAPELLAVIAGEGDHCMMKRDAMTDYCVKFDNGLCGIQKQYGADFLGDACNFYPRMTRMLGSSHVMTGALSCPEITRLVLFGDTPFACQEAEAERLQRDLPDYLPPSFTEAQALALHAAFIQKALDEKNTAARNLMHIASVAQSLEKLPPASWPDAVPFYLDQADKRLPAALPVATDPFFLLQALCGLIAAAKKGQQTRLMENVRLMESALHVTIQWENLAIAHLPDSAHAAASLQAEWDDKWHRQCETLLRRYLAAQMSLALFPFAGLGDTFGDRMTIIGVRFATVRLTLMSACRVLGAVPDEAQCTRIVQTLSRFLDHLAGADFSLSIYKETGWNNLGRLRSLIGDNPH